MKLQFMSVLSLSAILLVSACKKDENTAVGTSAEQNQAAAPAAESAPAASENGIGPVSELQVGESIDEAMADKGKSVFEAKCSACHKIDERFVGPALKDVTNRRKPAWIMNMVLNPTEMLQKDPTAKELLAEYLTQMTFQNVSQDDVRAILEYFRRNDKK